MRTDSTGGRSQCMRFLPDNLHQIPINHPLTLRKCASIILVSNAEGGGEMVKRLNCHLTDELHTKLRVALAERGITFSDWVREHIEQFVSEAERERFKEAKGKRKGREG